MTYWIVVCLELKAGMSMSGICRIEFHQPRLCVLGLTHYSCVFQTGTGLKKEEVVFLEFAVKLGPFLYYHNPPKEIQRNLQ